MTYLGENAVLFRYPHAILVGHGIFTAPPYIKYTLTRGSDNQGLAYQKVPAYTFLDKKGIVKLFNLERRGWLIAKDDAALAESLTWFEGIAKSQVSRVKKPANGAPRQPHWTVRWAQLVFATLDALDPPSPSYYWLPYHLTDTT